MVLLHSWWLGLHLGHLEFWWYLGANWWSHTLTRCSFSTVFISVVRCESLRYYINLITVSVTLQRSVRIKWTMAKGISGLLGSAHLYLMAIPNKASLLRHLICGAPSFHLFDWGKWIVVCIDYKSWSKKVTKTFFCYSLLQWQQF